ncbi:MAG: APC family permease, partial [Sphaerospermopsis kisseleviana]
IVFSMLAVGFMMIPILGSVGIPSSNLFPVPEAPYNLFPYLFLIYLVTSCSWFLIKKQRSPHLVAGMQQRVDEIHASFAERNNY